MIVMTGRMRLLLPVSSVSRYHTCKGVTAFVWRAKTKNPLRLLTPSCRYAFSPLRLFAVTPFCVLKRLRVSPPKPRLGTLRLGAVTPLRVV